MPAHKDNKKGYWEDKEFTEFNDKLLAKTGQTWYEPKATNLEEIKQLAHEFNEEAGLLLRKKIYKQGNICLKDPRICNLIPFWKEICNRNKFKMRLIASYRHPIENANSILKRDSIEINQGLLLWIAHYVNLLNDVENTSICFVKYNDILSHPETEIQKVAKFLDQPININELNKFKSQFLDSSLRHNTETTNELKVEKKIINLGLDLYQTIESIKDSAQSELRPILSKSLSKDFIQKLISIDPNFCDRNRYHKIISDLKQTRHDIHTLHTEINTQINELHQSRHELQQIKDELILTRRLRKESRLRYTNLLNQINIITNSFWWKMSYPIRLLLSSKLSRDTLRSLKRQLNQKK